jgi:hypothetical protein
VTDTVNMIRRVSETRESLCAPEIGVPNVQILNRVLALKRFLASLRERLGRWEDAGRAHGVPRRMA